MKTRIGIIIKCPELSRLVLDHFKTKKMTKNAAKKFLFAIKYDLDRYKTKQLCDKVILEDGSEC